MKAHHIRVLLCVLVAIFIPLVYRSTVRAQDQVELTFWYWAESDAPGANKWLADTVEAYKKVKPNITVTVVTQSTDTLTSAFQAAVTADSGPDIASQWATGPVLGFVWQDALAPISDLVPADETKHWLNMSENKYNDKFWGASMYLLGTQIMYNKDLFKKAGVDEPKNGQFTWDEFVAAGKKLKAAGITPFAIGDKDGYHGAWWWSTLFAHQTLDSTEQLRQALVGASSAKFADWTQWYTDLDKLVKDGFFNPDTMSLTLDQGTRLFWKGDAAMSFCTDGTLKQALSDVGEDKVGVMRVPAWGKGKMADWGDATQSVTFLVTKWSSHQKEAADFLTYLHTTDRLNAWYAATGVVPADDRFDTSQIKSPQLKQMATWSTTGPQVWLENYLPAQVDSDADLAAGQMIFSQSASPADAAALWDKVVGTWRSQNAGELKNWKNWKQ